MSKLTKPIIVIVGAQWGSEAKGMVAAALGEREHVDVAVRTGAVNAGHTVWYGDREWKMQQLPVGWVNKGCRLIIGPGALVHPGILQAEIEAIEQFAPEADIRNRLMVDYRAGLHTEEHTDRAKASDRHHKIGATGKGCSEALIARVRDRGNGGKLFRDHPYSKSVLMADTVMELNRAYDYGDRILLEGTQGSLLDLYTGPYPYTTHKPTQASTWVQEAGLSPALDYDVVLVARTFPIRVAGNSGPMPGEISWVDLARGINSRLERFKMRPRVKEDSLQAFETECNRIFQANFAWTTHTPSGPNIHLYTDDERFRYQDTVSELYKDVLRSLPPNVVKDLCRLFEMTTVTRKMRRIATFSGDLLRPVIQMNRPSMMVMTFANYMFPEIWNTSSWDEWGKESIADCEAWIDNVAKGLEVDIPYITTGACSQHMLNFADM